MTSKRYIGVDLGQKRDHTAVVVVDRVDIIGPEIDAATRAPIERTKYRVLGARRLPLGHASRTILA